MKTLLLTKTEVDQLIKMPDVIEAVEEAYKTFSSKQVVQPGYIGIALPDHRGEIDFKLGYSRVNEIISMKAHSGGFTDNPQKYDVPNSMGTVLLFDGNSGTLICVMDGSLITGLRTGAAGAVSARALARKNARIVSCIGTGNQARMQIRALVEVMKIDEIHAWSRTPDKRMQFKTEIEQEFGINVTIATFKKDAVEQADILVTTTRGKGDVIDASWVKPGTHIVAIGTDAPGKQEFDPEIFRTAKTVVDSVSQCCEKGETSHALEHNIITRDGIHAEIGEILLGHKSGRESEDEITLFDSTGMAIQDNTTANRIYQNAINRNIGSFFTFFE